MLLAGAGEGTLFSLFESGGGGLFDDFAAVLDGCDMADRLDMIVEGKLSRSIVVAGVAAKTSRVFGLLTHAGSNLVDAAWISWPWSRDVRGARRRRPTAAENRRAAAIF